MSSSVDSCDLSAVKKNTPSVHMSSEQVSTNLNFLQSESKSHLKAEIPLSLNLK